MINEIGSSFDLNPEINIKDNNYQLELETFNLIGNDYEILSSGRGATNLILETITKRKKDLLKIALIPSFTCDSVIEPFLKHNFKIYYYPVNEKLQIDINKFKDILIRSQAQVVFVHSYFGFNTLKGFEEIIEEFSEKGISFIEDRTQCLYSNFKQLPVDYIICSLRKWAGLPDGGLAVCTEGIFNIKLDESDKSLDDLKLKASYAKYNYLKGNFSDKKVYLDLFNKAEQKLASQNTYYKMSSSSISLQNKLDIKTLKHTRRSNYNRLYSKLIKIDEIKIITPKLTKKDVPLYITLSFKERNKLQSFLRDHNIYAPIIWPKPLNYTVQFDEVDHIYETVLSLPIDQRYDVNEMDKIITSIEEFFNK